MANQGNFNGSLEVYELDSTSIHSTPSQPSLAIPKPGHSAHLSRDRVVSSYAPGFQNQDHDPMPSSAARPLSYQQEVLHALPRSPAAQQYPPRGKFIVLEGLDRSGKTTQCEKLAENLREQGSRVELVRFPDRTTPIGQMIDAYLSGESEIEDHVVHLLFSANRWEAANQIATWIADGVTVIVDRYYYSGCVYSAAKQIPGLGLEWARHPDVGLPRPDLCIFLDVSPETASQRGGYGGEVYERTEMQIQVRELFEVLLGHPDEENDVVIVNADREIADVERTIQKWVRLAGERVDRQNLPLDAVKAW